MENSMSNSTKKVIGSLVLGALAGATIGVLYARKGAKNGFVEEVGDTAKGLKKKMDKAVKKHHKN
jgi:hypothetical protein